MRQVLSEELQIDHSETPLKGPLKGLQSTISSLT